MDGSGKVEAERHNGEIGRIFPERKKARKAEKTVEKRCRKISGTSCIYSSGRKFGYI